MMIFKYGHTFFDISFSFTSEGLISPPFKGELDPVTHFYVL